MAKCFAMDKDSIYTRMADRKKPDSEVTCYALNDPDFKQMKKYGHCGSPYCPFFKETREEVRHDY